MAEPNTTIDLDFLDDRIISIAFKLHEDACRDIPDRAQRLAEHVAQLQQCVDMLANLTSLESGAYCLPTYFVEDRTMQTFGVPIDLDFLDDRIIGIAFKLHEDACRDVPDRAQRLTEHLAQLRECVDMLTKLTSLESGVQLDVTP
jgi:hypothetical protein